MSCQACEQAQEIIPGNMTGLVNATWVRVGPANVLISGCDDHLKQLIDTLREGNHALDLKRLADE